MLPTMPLPTALPPSEGTAKSGGYKVDDLERHFQTLGVKGRFRRAAAATTDAASTSEDGKTSSKASDADLERRREIKKEVKAALDSHNAEQGQLVYCGKACKEKNTQVTAAYQALDSVLPRVVYKTFYGQDGTKRKRWTSPDELKRIYEEKVAAINAEVTDDEDKEMILAEAKDAYDILRSPDAHAFYHLYGRKPNEAMKKTSARHGGWGQELLLGTYKFRLIFGILDYFSNTWADTVVIGGLVLLLLARLPSIISQTMKMQAVLEAQEELDEMTTDE